MTINLRPFTNDDLQLFITWLNAVHVKPWYSPIEDWITEIKQRNTEYSWIKHFIIYADEVPVGFCQYYPYWKSGEDWNGSVPAENTYSIDYMIGNADYLRKGIAAAALKQLNQMIFNSTTAKRIIVQPDSDNKASQNTLLSAGYTYDGANELYIIAKT